MKNSTSKIEKINSIGTLHSFLGLQSPLNPLVTVINHSDLLYNYPYENLKLNMDLYNITVKRNFKDQIKYGKNSYDYDKGSMSFIAPNQIIAMANQVDQNNNGWSLVFHPDLIRKYTLNAAIKKYGFFSYEVYEGLHLSEEEEKTIDSIIKNIHNEINSRIDNFSQDVIVSNLELLLSYCNRFYNRQFLTRKMASNDLLTKFETLLESYFFEDVKLVELPKVEKIAKELNVSSSYLSDMLRTITGQNTQQHIHEKLIEKAKQMLTTTELSVNEVAFSLGFEYSQSFSKLFKSKTNQTPIEYRNSFN